MDAFVALLFLSFAKCTMDALIEAAALFGALGAESQDSSTEQAKFQKATEGSHSQVFVVSDDLVLVDPILHGSSSTSISE